MKILSVIQILIVSVVLLISSCIQPGNKKAVTLNREDTEWLDVWIPNTNDKDLPRVLFIGNSITRAYYSKVETHLKGKAYAGRLTTSKSLGDPAFLDEIVLVLKSTRFDIVHFNNGLHGWEYSEAEYRDAFPGMIQTIKTYAPDAKLIWASTTPVRTGEKMDKFDPKTDRVKARNRIAFEEIKDQNIMIDDLFSFVENHPEYYEGGDGTHLVEGGVAAMAFNVAEIIQKVL